MRYSFQKIYNQRKIFKINYSYFPYTLVNKSTSYDKNAQQIYESTGMLNITKLDYYYRNKNIKSINLNHIHLSMGFDNYYTDLSTISIMSIINTSNPDTFIHFHFLCLNLKFKDMKKIIQLKRKNKNIDYVFYNSQQLEYDFGKRAKHESRGLSNYARLLAPQIVNNTNRILVLDSGDIIVQKDISEIYFYDLEDNYFACILEDVAGNYKNKYDYFYRNKLYLNGGILLFNIRLFRKDDLYKKIFFVSLSYPYLTCPCQDILITISIYKFKYMPLNYNCKPFINDNKDIYKINKNMKTKKIKNMILTQQFSPYKYSINELFDAAKDPVIIHFYHDKIIKGHSCTLYTIQWIKYAKLTGLFKII